MTGGQIAVAIVVAAIGGGGVWPLIQLLVNRRTAIAADERQARRELAEDRRDTIADRDALLKTVLEEVRELRARVIAAERTSSIRSDHIDTLEHHIYQGLGPPPPPRPEGA